MMKLATIFLITLNLWGSFLCCCKNAGCSLQEAMCASQAPAVQTPAGCHGGSQKQATPSPPACHASAAADETTTPLSQTFERSCSCSTHDLVELSFTVPHVANQEVLVWYTYDIAHWFAEVSLQTQATPFFAAGTQGLTPPNRAPGLSALARFII